MHGGGFGMNQEHYISYLREEANHEIARLKMLLRDPRITEEDRGVALAMLEFYEDARMTEGRSSQQAPEGFVPRRTRRALGTNVELQERENTSRKKAQAA